MSLHHSIFVLADLCPGVSLSWRVGTFRSFTLVLIVNTMVTKFILAKLLILITQATFKKLNKSTQRAQTSTNTKIWNESDPGLKCDFQTDPDVHRICPKCCGCIILASVLSNFAKYDTNQPLIVWEMLTNVQVSYSAMVKKMCDTESTHRSGSPSKVNHF